MNLAPRKRKKENSKSKFWQESRDLEIDVTASSESKGLLSQSAASESTRLNQNHRIIPKKESTGLLGTEEMRSPLDS